MSLAIWFWVLYVIALVFGCYTNRATVAAWVGNGLIYFILLGILGYAVFGSAIK